MAGPGVKPARANVEVVRRVYDSFKSGDLAGAFAAIAPDVEITQSEEVPWGGTYSGHDGAAAFFAKLYGAVTSALTFERFIDAGDRVVAIGWSRGTVNATGRAFDVPIAHVWQLRDGLVVRVAFCIDNPTMRAALE